MRLREREREKKKREKREREREVMYELHFSRICVFFLIRMGDSSYFSSNEAFSIYSLFLIDIYTLYYIVTRGSRIFFHRATYKKLENFVRYFEL